MGYCPPNKNTLQSSNFLLPPLTGNKKHEDVKQMHEHLIQHNSWQIKKKVKSQEIE